jgi:hypothetical protein
MAVRVINNLNREITVAQNQVVFAASANVLNSFALAAGQLVGASATGVPQAVTLAGGTNVTIDTTTTPGSYIINGSPSTTPGLSYVPVTAATATLAQSQIAVSNGSALQTLSLPASPVIGGIYGIEGGLNSAGWVLQAATGQTIVDGDVTSVAGGTITNGDTQYDAIQVLALSATQFKVVDSSGNPKMQIS